MNYVHLARRFYFYRAIMCIAIGSNSLLYTHSGYMGFRSESLNSARDSVGWHQHINQPCEETMYGALSAAFEYTQSFRPERIARSLFGQDLDCSCTCPKITISGSQVTDRGDHDWLADYAGLPTDYHSAITFNPTIRSILVDFQWYLGLAQRPTGRGFYFWVHAPLVNTRWNLNPCETVINSGINAQEPGYFTVTRANEVQAHPTDPEAIVSTPRKFLVDTFMDWASGDQIPFTKLQTTITPAQSKKCGERQNISQHTIGLGSTKVERLNCARLSQCEIERTRLADVRVSFGYNVKNNDRGNLGLELRVAAPAGNSPTGTYLFDPVIGNGGFWELGCGIQGQGILVQNEAETRQLIGTINIGVTHLFERTFYRVADLSCKPNSKYMLAQELRKTPAFDTQAVHLPIAAQTEPLEFADHLLPVANISCIWANVKVNAQVDATGMLSYVHNNIIWDIGYNFWYRSCEQIATSCKNPAPLSQSTTQQFALKGDASVIGFLDTDPVALAAIDNKATIRHGSNFPPTGADDAQFAEGRLNPGIILPQEASVNSSPVNDLPANSSVRSPMQTQSSNPPRTPKCLPKKQPFYILQTEDIWFTRTTGMSHKLFTHINYTWNDHVRWHPFVGLGAEVEFGRDKPYIPTCYASCTDSCDAPATNCCVAETSLTSCDPCGLCVDTSLSQWGIWVKGGFGF